MDIISIFILKNPGPNYYIAGCIIQNGSTLYLIYINTYVTMLAT